ncbi:ATP-dependent DNA helicase-like protein [Synergistales bacterium]|nr:ATP-dependent DNA helicase-like protein [Synergistales bacterium]
MKTTISDFFAPNGALRRRFKGYEHRPQQGELAAAIQAFLFSSEESVMAAEAPPGVGKTFAVLIPAISLAIEQEKRILFLTASITLQEQLIDKDLPKLKSVLGKDFAFGLLKGRSNYVCLRRASVLQMSSAANQASFSFEGNAVTETGAPVDFAQWTQETQTGDLTELSLSSSHPLSYQISAGRSGCMGMACPFRWRCFVTKSYREAQDWQVIVANYHLFFSHILGGHGSFPVPYDWLVCDEAHRIPEAARSAARVEADARDGEALLRPRAISGFEPLLTGELVDMPLFKERAEACRASRAALFDFAETRFNSGESITERDDEALRRAREFSDCLENMQISLRILDEKYRAGGFENATNLGEATALVNWLGELSEYKKAVMWCLSVEKFPLWGYWRAHDTLSSAPVVCADIIKDAMSSEEPEKTILISATLSLSGDFSYWMRETGMQPDRKLVVNSPFDYERQMELVVVEVGLSVGAAGYDDRIAKVIERMCDENKGRSLVLLSSNRLLNAVAARMRKSARDYEILVQGDLPQKELLRKFRDIESSILIGSVSFRDGVDIPGEALTQVIIDRIPFAHPSDPLNQARDALEGRNAFMTASLPSAKIFLRQAVGRLIRSSKDHGRVAILDGRVLTKEAWDIPGSLPKCKIKRLTVK